MFAETLAGIALVKSAVDGIKSVIGTARDISAIADDIDEERMRNITVDDIKPIYRTNYWER